MSRKLNKIEILDLLAGNFTGQQPSIKLLYRETGQLMLPFEVALC